MLALDKSHRLTVSDVNSKGVYVDALDFGQIFLRKAPESLVLGDKVDVFLYQDSAKSHNNIEGDIVALYLAEKTTHAVIGTCANLEVLDVNDHGAFLDWGLPKDLLLPYSEQAYPVKKGDFCVVYIDSDERGRGLASMVLHRYLNEDNTHFKRGDAVDILVAAKTELGFKAVINNRYLGLVYHQDLSQPLVIGSRMKAWIKLIREDGKIDLSINTLDNKTRDQLEQKILTKLKNNNGKLMLSDKSSPETIFKLFGVSKRNFKRALGSLYKQRLIALESNYIELKE